MFAGEGTCLKVVAKSVGGGKRKALPDVWTVSPYPPSPSSAEDVAVAPADVQPFEADLPFRLAANSTLILESKGV